VIVHCPRKVWPVCPDDYCRREMLTPALTAGNERAQSMPHGDQLARQWPLLYLLDHSAAVAVGRSARGLGCAVGTISRDLRVPRTAQFPVHGGLIRKRRFTGAIACP
jgi:hypothetical protein